MDVNEGDRNWLIRVSGSECELIEVCDERWMVGWGFIFCFIGEEGVWFKILKVLVIDLGGVVFEMVLFFCLFLLIVMVEVLLILLLLVVDIVKWWLVDLVFCFIFVLIVFLLLLGWLSYFCKFDLVLCFLEVLGLGKRSCFVVLVMLLLMEVSILRVCGGSVNGWMSEVRSMSLVLVFSFFLLFVFVLNFILVLVLLDMMFCEVYMYVKVK